MHSSNDFLNTNTFGYASPSIIIIIRLKQRENSLQSVHLLQCPDNSSACRTLSLPCVNQTHNIASFCTGRAHDCCLCAWIDECLDRHAVHFAIDIQHDDSAKSFRIVFHGSFHVRLNVFLSNFLGDQALCLMVKWISFHHSSTLLCTFISCLYLLTQYSRKRLQITGQQCIGQWRIVLFELRINESAILRLMIFFAVEVATLNEWPLFLDSVILMFDCLLYSPVPIGRDFWKMHHAPWPDRHSYQSKWDLLHRYCCLVDYYWGWFHRFHHLGVHESH